MHSSNAWHLSVTGAALLALAACGGGGNGSTVAPSGELQYNTKIGLLPSPNDLAFAGSSNGTLNNTDNDAVDPTDGFSTTASATATTSVPIDPPPCRAAAACGSSLWSRSTRWTTRHSRTTRRTPDRRPSAASTQRPI